MPRALACPASLKGVLSAREASAALAAGLRDWSDVDELPLADGGEGTLDVLHAAVGGDWRTYNVHDAFGRPRRAKALWNGASVAVEAAEVIPLDSSRLDPISASSRGLGELIAQLGSPSELLVCLGGTANVDGGGGMVGLGGALPTKSIGAGDEGHRCVRRGSAFARCRPVLRRTERGDARAVAGARVPTRAAGLVRRPT